MSRPLDLIVTLTALVTIALSTGCTTNPATGEAQLNMLSREQEIAMGEEAMPQLIQEYGGEVQSQELRSYVTNVGMRLAKKTEADYPELPWEFTVLDSEVINAFALPGGKVFISRGLMQHFDNEAQLAGVLGHEIGHVVAQHIDQRISRAMGVELLGQIAAAAVGDESAWARAVPTIVGLGGQGYLLSFSRSQETESDVLGVKYMTKAGYDPKGMLQVIRVLEEASEGNLGWELLSTHPHPETRRETVTRLLEGDYAYTQGNPEYRLYPGRYERNALPHLE